MESKGRVFQWKGMEQKPCSQHQEPSPPDELHRRSGGPSARSALTGTCPSYVFSAGLTEHTKHPTSNCWCPRGPYLRS